MVMGAGRTAGVKPHSPSKVGLILSGGDITQMGTDSVKVNAAVIALCQVISSATNQSVDLIGKKATIRNGVVTVSPTPGVDKGDAYTIASDLLNTASYHIVEYLAHCKVGELTAAHIAVNTVGDMIDALL